MIAARAAVLRGDGRGVLWRKIRIIAASQSGAVDFHLSIEHVDESLHRRGLQRAARFELRRVLREPCAYGGRGVNDRRRLVHSGQRRTDERIGRLQKVVGAMSAASLSQVVHKCSDRRSHEPAVGARSDFTGCKYGLTPANGTHDAAAKGRTEVRDSRRAAASDVPAAIGPIGKCPPEPGRRPCRPRWRPSTGFESGGPAQPRRATRSVRVADWRQ